MMDFSRFLLISDRPIIELNNNGVTYSERCNFSLSDHRSTTTPTRVSKKMWVIRIDWRMHREKRERMKQQEENMMMIHQFFLLFSRSGSSVSSSSTTVTSESVSTSSVSVSTTKPKPNRGKTKETLELLDLSQVTFRTTIAELFSHFSFYSAPSKCQIFPLIYPLVILNDCSTIVDLKESIRH